MWSSAYLATKTDSIPDMDKLMEWLPAHVPQEDKFSQAITHGDYRVDNLIYDSAAPRVAAVLDWELSTLGHPVSQARSRVQE